VKRIAETLGVARSNLIERAGGRRPKRGPPDPRWGCGAHF
jgi:putative transposase